MAFKKAPDAVLDYTLDWSSWLLPTLDVIVGVVWISSGEADVVSSSHTSTTATAFISGGVVDTTETVTCRVTTAGGRTDDRSIFLKIIHR